MLPNPRETRDLVTFTEEILTYSSTDNFLSHIPGSDWLKKKCTMNSYYRYTSIPKSPFNKKYTAYHYWRKVSKIFHTFWLHLRLPAIINLIFCTVRLENFMTSCRDKLYHHHASIKINSSSPPEVFLGKGVLKICSKFTGEHPCQSVISIKLLINFIEITLPIT